jgi:hypothetical protein
VRGDFGVVAVDPSPYRQPPEAPSAEDRGALPGDHDLVPVFALLWIVSVVHVSRVVAHAERFGTIDVLAAITIVMLPALVREPRRDGVRKS